MSYQFGPHATDEERIPVIWDSNSAINEEMVTKWRVPTIPMRLLSVGIFFAAMWVIQSMFSVLVFDTIVFFGCDPSYSLIRSDFFFIWIILVQTATNNNVGKASNGRGHGITNSDLCSPNRGTISVLLLPLEVLSYCGIPILASAHRKADDGAVVKMVVHCFWQPY